MIHPSTELRLVNSQIGLGVYATSLIPKGTLVYVKDALEIEIPPDSPLLQDANLFRVIDCYSYLDARGVRVMSWDIGKHVNHSCRPNTLTTGYGFEIALRDIQPGEQVTDDYGLFNLEWELACACGEPECRGSIHRRDFERYAPMWDAWAREALSCFGAVDQPLLPFVDKRVIRQLRQYLSTGRAYQSVRKMKYEPEVAAPASRPGVLAKVGSNLPVSVGAALGGKGNGNGHRRVRRSKSNCSLTSLPANR